MLRYQFRTLLTLPRYELRTLLILLAMGPMVLAAMWWSWPRIERLTSFVGPWDMLMAALVVFIVFGHDVQRLGGALFGDFDL